MILRSYLHKNIWILIRNSVALIGEQKLSNYSKFLFEAIINDSNENEIINLGEKW